MSNRSGSLWLSAFDPPKITVTDTTTPTITEPNPEVSGLTSNQLGDLRESGVLGRQVSFYMAREDEDEFLDFVRATGDISILPSKSSQEDIQPIEALPLPFSKEFWFSYVFFNRRLSRNLVVRHIPETGRYSVDTLQSSVIEFTRSSMKDGTMRAGRIWAQFTYVDSDKTKLLPKEVAFKEWYETIAKWIRKRYKRFDRQVYVGPNAQRLASEGVRLE